MKKVFYVFGFLLILVLSHVGELKATLKQVEGQLELITNRQTSSVARRNALIRLEKLRQNWPEEEGAFESQIAPLKPQIIAAAQVVSREFLPQRDRTFRGIVSAIAKRRGIHPVLSFLAYWPIVNEDIEDGYSRVQVSMRLAKTFPNWLDFGKAQPLLPKLTEKFGDARAYDLSRHSPWTIQLLKAKVYLDAYTNISAAFDARVFLTAMTTITLFYYLMILPLEDLDSGVFEPV